MLVEEVAKLYSTWVDETNAAWHTSVLPLLLARGYNMFRQKVIRQQPLIYATSINIQPSQYQYDLANDVPSIMGSSPMAARLETILELRYIEGDGHEGTRVQLVPDAHQLARVVGTAGVLRGSIIQFNATIGEQLKLWYIPETSVDWAKTITGDNEWIDDLGAYHELIAVYASQYYAIKDGMTPSIGAIKNVMEEELDNFLFRYNGQGLQMGSEY